MLVEFDLIAVGIRDVCKRNPGRKLTALLQDAPCCDHLINRVVQVGFVFQLKTKVEDAATPCNWLFRIGLVQRDDIV